MKGLGFGVSGFGCRVWASFKGSMKLKGLGFGV